MRIATAGCLAILMATSGSPVRADMRDAFGNTIVSRYPNGKWVKHYFEPDGRYSADFSDGRHWTGRWSQDGERVCLSQIRPRQVLPRFCTRMVEAEVGDNWPSRDPLGRSVRNELVAGR